MRKIGFVLLLLTLVVGSVAYEVWKASHDPVTTPAGPLELGRIKLHAQLEDTKRDEAEVEKKAWDHPEQLQQLIKAHEHRMEELKGNTQADEILAYDREAVLRLDNRMAQIAAQQAAQAAAAAEKAQEAPAADAPKAP